jgi:cysteine desulfurase
MRKLVYLDNHSTTRVDPRVLEVMLPFFSECFGNAASSSHSFGRQAQGAVEQARKEIASLIGAKAREIVFTSGATESINLGLKGVALSLLSKGNHIVTSAIEHPAVLDTCNTLRKQGFDISILPVDNLGLVDPVDVKRAIGKKTILVSIMHANNEIGVLQDIQAIARVCHERDVIFHTDATQSVGKVPMNVDNCAVDLASFSAHKMYGPKGIGALYVRDRNPRIHVKPMIDGGGQEQGVRSGTLNVPAIVGFGKACYLAASLEETEALRVLELREALRIGLMNELDDVLVNGHLERRVPGNLNVSFPGVQGHSLMAGIQDVIAVSSGSACHSKSGEASHVLKAIGLSDELADSSIRFGVGRFNLNSDIAYTIDRFCEVINRLRRGSSITSANATLL